MLLLYLYYIASYAHCGILLTCFPTNLCFAVLYPCSRLALYFEPAEAALKEEGATSSEREASLDGRVKQLLEVVRLSALLEREGLSAKRLAWGNVLSLGEQQRIGEDRL